MVDTYVKPDVLERIDPQQFGAVPKSSTTHALISMLHSWLESTDGNGALSLRWIRTCTLNVVQGVELASSFLSASSNNDSIF